ncbi:MAG: hypothetical protein GY856_34920 [bacterium]|nr:hypothetical protein [bacterium]
MTSRRGGIESGGWRRWAQGLLLALLASLSSPALGQSIAVVPPVAALPSYGGGGASESFLTFRLGDGEAYLVDRLRRDPLALRRRRLAENLFAAVGRAADQPATTGEILLGPIHSGDGSVRAALYVETPIGYVAYFNQLGRGSRIGEFSSAIGRPFAPLAAADGNFALLMRRDGSGKTTTAYLYHATTGKCLYFAEVNKLETDLEAVATSPLPTLTGRVAATELRAGSEATAGYLVVDSGNGDLYFCDLDPARAGQLAVHKSARNLFEVFSREARYPSPRRFLPVSIQESSRQTRHVLIFDAATGEMALVENVDDRARTPALRQVGRNVDTSFQASDRMTRVFAAVPNVTGNGATIGVWLVDNQTGAVVYVANPAVPAAVTVTRVAFER